jgi:glyoxylase-like metal-dependent hydrolase (beta-lactamase superfamily II)
VKRISIIFTFIVIFYVCTSQTEIPLSIKTNRLSQRLAVFEALNVNVTVVASQDGLLIVDTQRSPGMMAEILKAAQTEFGRDDVLHVINTHGHWDHASGNQLFPDSLIIGHSNCPEYIRQTPANSTTNIWSVRNHLKELKQELDTLKGNSEREAALRAEIAGRKLVLDDLESCYVPTPPAKVFHDSLTLRLSDMTVKLFYAGNAHTNNDIIIYVPEEKTMITGDLFTTPSYYGFRVNQMTDVERLVWVIDRILNDKHGFDRVITSHSDIMTGDDLAYIRSSLLEKHSQYVGKNSAATLLDQWMKKDPLNTDLSQYKQQIFGSDADYYLLEEEFSMLGRRLMGEGKMEAALAVFQLTSEIFPESALAFDNLGEIYLKMGNVEKAIQNYEISLRIMPYNKNAAEILKIIRGQ